MTSSAAEGRNKNNDFSSDISYNKRTEKQQIEEIMDDVRENDQRLFYVAVTIIIKADTKEELEATVIMWEWNTSPLIHAEGVM